MGEWVRMAFIRLEVRLACAIDASRFDCVSPIGEQSWHAGSGSEVVNLNLVRPSP